MTDNTYLLRSVALCARALRSVENRTDVAPVMHRLMVRDARTKLDAAIREAEKQGAL